MSRLVIHPDFQERNLASKFVSAAIKLLRKQTHVRCLLSYADSEFHYGTVYQATNFSYYGLTDKKKDFFYKTENGFIKHSRGKIKGLEGEWRYRSQKHRYVMIFDKDLLRLMKWTKKAYPKPK